MQDAVRLGGGAQLLPQAVDHVGAGAVCLGGEAQSLGQAAGLGPVHRSGRPIGPRGARPGSPAQEGKNLIIGQGAGQVEDSASHAAGDTLLGRPEDRIIVVGALIGNVREGRGRGGGGGGTGRPPQESDRLCLLYTSDAADEL